MLTGRLTRSTAPNAFFALQGASRVTDFGRKVSAHAGSVDHGGIL
jgi:hypothetical protein